MKMKISIRGLIVLLALIPVVTLFLLAGARTAAAGSRIFTITPDTGYYVSDVMVDGADQGAIG
jgi:ABC-type sugar transport system substrate-binding protein